MCRSYASSFRNIFIVFYSYFFFLLLSLFFEVYNPDFIKQVSGTKVRFKLLNDLKIYNRELTGRSDNWKQQTLNTRLIDHGWLDEGALPSLQRVEV